MISDRVDRDGFEAPSFMQDVDAKKYLAQCHRDSTTRGAFFDSLRQAVEHELGAAPDALFEGLEVRRWIAFKSYPLRDFMVFALNSARLLHPRATLAEGLRRVGWLSFPSFARTIAGKVVLFAMGETLDNVCENAPKAYSLSVPAGKVTTHKIAAHHWLFEMRDLDCFVDTYQYGVVEGAIKSFGFEPDVRIKRLPRWCDADFDIRWRE